MITATPPPAKTSSKKIVDLWASLPTSYSEADLGANFMARLFDYLGLNHPSDALTKLTYQNY